MDQEIAPFSLWSLITQGGCTIAVSPYHKFHGGVSLRDVQALVKTTAALSRRMPPHLLRVVSTERFDQEAWMSNQVLIGGRLSNQALKFFTETWDRITPLTSLVLDRNLIRDTLRQPGRDHLVPRFKTGLPFDAKNALEDYGMIVCLPNPILGRDKRIINVSGIKGWGSMAAAEGFSNPLYYQALEEILHNLGYDPLGEDRNTVVEIVLWASVVERQIGRNLLDDLGEIKPVLVRLGASAERQWENPDFQHKWRSPLMEEPRVRPAHITLTAIFGDNAGQKPCMVELEGGISQYEMVEANLPDTLIDELNRELAMFDHSRDTVQSLVDRLRPSLVGALPERFWAALDKARAHVNVRLPQEVQVHIVGTPSLIKFPFELVELNRGDYLAWRHPISRSLIGQTRTRSILEPRTLEQLMIGEGRLRVLLVSCDARGDLPQANQEVDEIGQQLGRVVRDTRLPLDVTILRTDDASADALRQGLIDRRPHIVHFAGHAFFDAATPDRSYLLLRSESGAQQPVYITELCEWARQSPDLMFFYLSACQGASGAAEESREHSDFLGIADALLRAGVPAVLGFRWPVSDCGARRLAVKFYQALFVPDLTTPAQALFMARAELAAQGREDPAWLSPILISHME